MKGNDGKGKVFLSIIAGLTVVVAMTCFFANVFSVTYTESLTKAFRDLPKDAVLVDENLATFVGIDWLLGGAPYLEKFSCFYVMKIDLYVILALPLYFTFTRGIKSSKARSINEFIIVVLSAISIGIFCYCCFNICDTALEYYSDGGLLYKAEGIYPANLIHFNYSTETYGWYYAIIGGVLFALYICLFIIVSVLNKKKSSKNILEQLKNYATLREEKAITEEEYQSIKNDLINSISKKQVPKNKLEALSEFKNLLDDEIINEKDFVKLKKILFYKGE